MEIIKWFEAKRRERALVYLSASEAPTAEFLDRVAKTVIALTAKSR